MTDIRMCGKLRTDEDCEATGFPAQRWGEAVFKIQEEELVLEISVEKDIMVAIMLGEAVGWKGTLKGLKMLFRETARRK